MSLYEGNSGDTHIYLIFHAQFSPFLAHCMLKGYLCKVFKSFRAGGLSDVFCFKVLPMYRLALKMDFGRQNRNKSYVGTIHLHTELNFRSRFLKFWSRLEMPWLFWLFGFWFRL